MSYWTYIDGTITVVPAGETQPQKRYILETILAHLPRVTGSERDMEVHIVQPNGDDSSLSCDEFGENTNNLVVNSGSRPYKSRDGWLHTQTKYILVLHAALRDRMFDETKREFMKWLTRLAKRAPVNDICVKLSAYEDEIILTDESPFRLMYELPSWARESGEPAWWEFMTWDRAKGSNYPMYLEYKYYNDPENDAEVERRMAYERS